LQGLQLLRQFAGDLFDRFGIEHFDGFRERTQRSPWTAKLLLHFFSSLAC